MGPSGWTGYAPLYIRGHEHHGGHPLAWVLFALLLLVLFFTITGIPPTEEQALRSRGEDYRRYQQETSIFVPWFPKRS